LRVLPLGTRDRIATSLWLLVGSMLFIELLLELADYGFVGQTDWRAIAIGYGGFWRQLLSGEQPLFSLQPYTMFLSHAFLHGGFIHFIMNSVILLALGKFISERTGSAAMLLLFASSAISGAIVFALISDSTGPAVGASGAVFGFIGLWQYWEVVARRNRGLSLNPVLRTIFGLIIINLAIALVLQGALAWEAHLGGFVAGFALGPFMTIRARSRGFVF